VTDTRRRGSAPAEPNRLVRLSNGMDAHKNGQNVLGDWIRTNAATALALFRDDPVTDDVLFIGDEDDDVMALGWPQLLQARLGVLERRAIRHRVHYQIRFHQIATLVRLHSSKHRPLHHS